MLVGLHDAQHSQAVSALLVNGRSIRFVALDSDRDIYAAIAKGGDR